MDHINNLAKDRSTGSFPEHSPTSSKDYFQHLGQFQDITDSNSSNNTSLENTQMTSFSKKSKRSTSSQSGEFTPLRHSPSKQFKQNFGGTSFTNYSDSDSDNLQDDVSEEMPFVQQPNLFALPQSYAYLSWVDRMKLASATVAKALIKYAKFIGPGIMVSVAYMDPGNYSTAVSAGALYKYKLLFVVLVSNLFAVFLQTLCVKLGSVTGLDLAQNCREHLPRWLCISIYVLAEIAIIATDLAEVVGTAIALNILFHIPLAIGVLLTVIDVLLVLMAYRPNGEMKIVRYFEYLVSFLVVLVVICFAIELGNIGPVSPGEIFSGFLPSSELLETKGLYLSCGILGATVMPHSLYLGSGLVQPRLREFDKKHGYYSDASANDSDNDDMIKYKPSIYAINYAMTFSIIELVISLFTVAIFINSSILIVAGATLSNTPGAVDADLFSIYDMLQKYLSPAAGTVFALALLFSGQSAGIVCTLSGQMVSEGFLHWSFRPWIRRLITRGLAIAPCLFVALFVGRKGLADVLNASQVVLSLLLPFVSAPLLYFTCKKSIMRVPLHSPVVNFPARAANTHHEDHTLSPTRTLTESLPLGTTPPVAVVGSNGFVSIPADDHNDEEDLRFSIDSSTSSIIVPEYKDMSNGKYTNIAAVVIFSIVSCLNIFMIVSIAMGADVHF